MSESVFENIGILASGLLTAYWICMVVGGGLLVISTVLGSHGADADMDVGLGTDVDADLSLDTDMDMDADVATADTGGGAHAGPASLASWFSVHFVVYFAAMFGVVGVTLSHLTELRPVIVAISSVLGGLVIGQSVHRLMRYLRRTSGNSQVSAADYQNKPARVTIRCAPGCTGEVAVMVGGGERYVPALPKHDEESFNTGERVAVVSYCSGVAEVISMKEFEFMGAPKRGVEL